MITLGSELDKLGALLLSAGCPKVLKSRHSLLSQVSRWLEASLDLDPTLPTHTVEGITFLRAKLEEKKVALDAVPEED